jgi:hypothetical protein
MLSGAGVACLTVFVSRDQKTIFAAAEERTNRAALYNLPVRGSLVVLFRSSPPAAIMCWNKVVTPTQRTEVTNQ